MKALFYKELKLAVPHGMYLFMLLSVLVMVPNYPMIVSVGYGILAISILFNISRANRDLEFSTVLPVPRRDIVKSKVAVVALFELLQVAAAIPFALIANLLISPRGSLVGLDPNFAFFGVALLCYAAFNVIFFPWFFRSGFRVGAPLLSGLAGFLAVYAVFELLINLIPGWGAALDTLSPAMFGYQSILLAAGIVCFALSVVLSCVLSYKKFERVSL